MMEPGRSPASRAMLAAVALLVIFFCSDGLYSIAPCLHKAFGQAAAPQNRARRGRAIPPAAPGGALPVALQPGNNETAVTDGADSVFYPPDRATMQRFSAARERLEEKRYSEAVRLLGSILEKPEDFFFQPDRDQPIYRSLKGEARRLIGEMPTEGKESYELQYGARARQLLGEAIAAGDVDKLAEVSRQHFHTQAGYEAAYLLGISEMEHGRPLAAALCLRRLQETPRAAAPFEPRLSLRIAVCWQRAGMPAQAAETLRKLKQQYPDAEFKIGGKTRKLFSADSQALVWLAESIGAASGPGLAGAELSGAEQWAMYRGAPTRNAVSSGSSPLLNRRWAVPAANDPQLEKQLAEMQQEHLEQGDRLTPGFHPLAVNGYVFMRSVACLEAIDFRTGKRVWNGPVEKQVSEMLLQGGGSASAGQQGTTFANWLEHRVWDDAPYGTLSSDGENVYCVEDLAGNMHDSFYGAVRQGQRIVINNGQPVAPNTIYYNRLAAYEIATEGKLKWTLGGEPKEDAAALSGAFFLGPPLPLAGRLYVLAELRGEIRLYALDAHSGDVLWSQQIAIVERNILEDPLRRIAGASPSYSDGVLVCPTSSGAVVALDLTTRSLLWGYQYPRAVDPTYQNRMMQFRFGGIPINEASENDRWAEGSVTVAEGCVLLTPVESPNIHCLNLLDGKLRWQKPRDGGIYVACVQGGKAMLVDNRDVRALRLSDGEPAWSEASVPLPSGSMPSGRGFFDGKKYFLPLTSAEVAAIDVETGKIVGRSRSRTGATPGNLICYQGAVISQGIDQLECFYQLDDLRKQVAATLAKQPDDPQAMARQGELLLDEGKLNEAILQLRGSFEQHADPRTRELLVDALLEGLEQDFATHRQHADEIERFADQPGQKARFQRLMAAGLQEAGEIDQAFAILLEMADLKSLPEELDRIQHAWAARRDRWMRARFDELWRAATPEQKQRIEQALHARFDRLKADELSSDSLRAFVAYFSAAPQADDARELLATRLMTGEGMLEAEQLFRRLESSARPERSRAAAARLAQMLLKGGRPADAAIYCRKLKQAWPDVVCLDGKTGRQLVDELSQAAEVKKQLAGPPVWPEGEVEQHAEQPTAVAPYRNVAIELRGPLGPFFEHATLESDQQQGALVGRDSLGREAWRVALHDRGAMNTFNFNPAVNYVRIDGHLLLASLGYQVVAIDALGAPEQGGPRVLWRQDLSDAVGAARQQVQIRAVNMPWGGMPRVQAIDVHGRPLGNIGPVTGDFACYQRLRNLTAVEPLTGEQLWVRSDVPAGSDLFGDSEMLFAVPPNSHEATVYRAIDGAELGRRQLPTADERATTLGRLVLAWTLGEANGRAVLKLLDPWEQKELWRKQYEADAKFFCLGEEAVGVLERSGRFALLSLPTGKAEIEAQVDAEPSLNEIYLVRSATRDVLLTNRPWRRQNNLNVMAAPNPGGVVIDGMAHGFDRATGKKVFSTRIEHKGLALNQPFDVPILAFAANIQSPVRNVQTPHGNVMCLDKRTGRVVYEEDIPNPIGSVDIVSDVDKHELLVRTVRSAKRLVFTDRPVAQQPEKEKPAKPKTADSTSQRAGRAILRGLRKWAGGQPAPNVGERDAEAAAEQK